MKFLITGGAGFIGSHLCDQLLEAGHTITCVDNFLTGSRKNIAHLVSNPSFRLVEADCSKPLTQLDPHEIIIHLASPASPPKYQKYPIETLLVNSIGTYELLKLAHLWQARFVFASTSEVYGDPLEHPQKETYWGNVNPSGPRSCYDEGKRCGEAFCYTYLKKYGVDVRVIRIFNTYGPRMDIDDGRVVTNFIGQTIRKQPLTIYGDGSQTRSFCFISDLVAGIVAVVESEKARGEIINLGNPTEHTIAEFAQIIKDLAHYEGELLNSELPEDDPKLRRPDIGKAQTLLGWESRVTLTEGLKKTLAYFQSLA